MPYTKILFKPGIDKEGTSLTQENGWFDGNLVRFRKGFPEKVGGWVKNNSNILEGTPRALHDWVNLDGTELLGLLLLKLAMMTLPLQLLKMVMEHK
jgi:hypothetical protein